MHRQINRWRIPVIVVAAIMAMTASLPAASAASIHGSVGARLVTRPLSTPHSAAAPSIAGITPAQVIHHTTVTTYFLTTSLVKIKTTTGKIRDEGLDAYDDGMGPISISLNLLRHNRSFSQTASNEWNLTNLRPSDFSVKAGNATVNFNSTQVGRFGRIYGTFTHTKAHPQTCTVSGSETEYTGRFTVNELFRTKNPLERHSKLGAVHGPFGHGGTIIFHNTSADQTQLWVDKGCLNQATEGASTCIKGTFWYVPDANDSNKGFLGEQYTQESPNPQHILGVFGQRSVGISGLPSQGGYAATPAVLVRYDNVYDTLRGQAFSLSATSPYPETVTVTPQGGDRYMQGGATLTSTSSASGQTGTCYAGSTKETSYDQTGAQPFTWTNHPTTLTADSAIGGNIVIGNQTFSSGGYIDHYTYQP